MARASLAFGLAVLVTACASIAGLEEPDPAQAVDVTSDGGADAAPLADTDSIEVTPTELNFNDVTCGTPSGNVPTFLLHNKGKKPVHYTVQVPEGSAFEVKGELTGDLAAGATVQFSAVAKPAVLGDNMTDITITTANAVAQVALKAKGVGGKLEAIPSIVDFGQVRYQNESKLDVALKNSGTQPITIATIDGVNADFDLTWAGKPVALSLAPNESRNVTVTMKSAATTVAPMATMLVPHVDGALCGTAPTIPVKGDRVNLDVTVSSADFGKQFCNTAPALQKDVVITNYSANALTYTAVLHNGAGSAFTIVDPGTGNLTAGNTTPTTAMVKLAMKAVGANLAPINEVLDVTINGIAAPSGGARTAPITADVRGIILTMNPTALDNYSNGQTRTYTITNSGNETFTSSPSFSRDANTTQQPAWSYNYPPSVGPGVTAGGAIKFVPQYCGTYGGTFTFNDALGTPICSGGKTIHVSGRVSCW